MSTGGFSKARLERMHDVMAGYVERAWYAALSAGAIALHMRDAKPHRATPYLLT